MAFRIAALTRQDLPAIERMLHALDVGSRCARFGWASSDESLMTHARNLVGSATHLIGAFAGGELRGILEVYADGTGRSAEVALVVAPPWRRRGFGQAMLAAAVAWAGQNSVSAIQLIFSRENWPMRRLAATVQARFDIALDEICAEIVVPAVRACGVASEGSA
jgi:GNAT superfamily N-acetyltransferase